MLKFVTILLLLIPKPFVHEAKQTRVTSANSLITGWYYVSERSNNFQRQLDRSSENYYIDPQPVVSVKHFVKVEIKDPDDKGKKAPYMIIRFDPVGAKAWAVATGKAQNKKLALIIDNKLIYAPQVNTQIISGVSALNRGNYSKNELSDFIKIIQAEW